jgi:hypothetical protein
VDRNRLIVRILTSVAQQVDQRKHKQLPVAFYFKFPGVFREET